MATKPENDSVWRAALVRVNNVLTRLRRVRVQPDELLLLVPHCLQLTRCTQNVKGDVDQCRRCGQCDVAGLIEIRDRHGIRCNLAAGGRQALGYVRASGVKAVVAVACEQELVAGIRAAFPKPVLAVPNERPDGPCNDTRVPLDAVDAAVRSLLAERFDGQRKH